MKKNTKYDTKQFLFLGCIAILSIFLFTSYFFINKYEKEKIILSPIDKHQNEANDVFSEELWRKNLEPFLVFKEEQDKKELKPPTKNESKLPPISEKPVEAQPSPVKPVEPMIQKEAYFASSLTGSSGAVFLSGKAVGYKVEINGKPINTTEGKFQQSTSSSFKVRFYNDETDQVVQISSPAYATSAIIKSLTVGVDPFNQYMTLHGRISLNLPGEMKGDLINVSNGTSNTTVLDNGSFNLSVPLQKGSNVITARGKWLTISLDLPSITVNLGH